MTANELRKLYVLYYKERRHEVAAAASLVPENDASVLYTTAGMQPLIPYLLGQEHPLGNRLVNIQRCVRTGDIEEVGDDYHLTVFEMLGNWSLGDYFKKEAISMSFGFLTEQLGIPSSRLAVTVHKGNDKVPYDAEATDSKYGDIVKVYEIPGYSLEICGGPHISNTSELGNFKIIKEQSSSSGVRRIKAIIDFDNNENIYTWN